MTPLFDLDVEVGTGKKPANTVGYAHVALEQGIDLAPQGLTYAVPSTLAHLAVGDRVLVPLGRKNKPAPGHVIALTDKCDFPSPKTILKRHDAGISLTPDLIQLATWMASYYCCPLGMVLRTMVPMRIRSSPLPSYSVATSPSSAM